MVSEDSRNYCAAEVREYDYARYFAAVFAPPQIRRSLLALYAFNLEIASTRERVSEPLIGEMRLQWWRDTLEAIYEGTVRNHAVVEELAAAIATHSLPKAPFDALIDARSFDLADTPPEDLPALERYAAATAGGLAGLAGTICGADHPAVVQAGTIWGLAGGLRAVPFHAATGRVFLPGDGLRAATLTPEAIISGAESARISSAAAPLVDRTGGLLQAFSASAPAIPRSARPAIAYLGVARLYLERLKRRKSDLFAAGLEPGRLAAQWCISQAALFGRY